MSLVPSSDQNTAFPIANDDRPDDPATLGDLYLRSDSEVHAGDIYLRWVLRKSCCSQFDLLVGYQAARINEGLSIDSTTLDPIGEAMQTISITDVFNTKNEYHAAHFGFHGEYRRGSWGVDFLAKFAFGNMRQTVSIDGSTITTDAAEGVDSRASGLLAQSATNGGMHVQDDFSFMNDAGIKLNYYPMERLKLSLGYSLMYWSSVVRPGDHVNLNVDGRLLTGDPVLDATEPSFGFNTTDFYVQGLNLGLELRF